MYSSFDISSSGPLPSARQNWRHAFCSLSPRAAASLFFFIRSSSSHDASPCSRYAAAPGFAFICFSKLNLWSMPVSCEPFRAAMSCGCWLGGGGVAAAGARSTVFARSRVGAAAGGGARAPPVIITESLRPLTSGGGATTPRCGAASPRAGAGVIAALASTESERRCFGTPKPGGRAVTIEALRSPLGGSEPRWAGISAVNDD